MSENLTPTPIPIVVEFPDIDLSGITGNQQTQLEKLESIYTELVTQNETLKIVVENQEKQLANVYSLYLETQIIALMIFMIFLWKWIKGLFWKRRKVDG